MKLYILLAVVAPILLGTAGVLQKRGLDELPKLSADWWFKDGKLQWDMIKKVLFTFLNIYFILGCIVGLAGGLVYMVALSMGDISIVQPLQGLGNLMAVILGVLWLHEKVKKREYIFIVLLIAGIVLLNMAA